jgi:hypothetical protein
LLLIAALCGVSLTSAAVAAVTATLIDQGAPSDGSITASGFTGWVIRLASDSGNITALDAYTDGGIFGPVVQRWSSSVGDGSYDTPTVLHAARNTTATALNFDSHLLPPTDVGSFAYPAPGFNESLGSGSIPPAGSGVGGGMPLNTDSAGIGISGSDGFLTGQYLLPGIDRSAAWDLAYVVLRNGDEDHLRGRVLVATAGGNFVVQIPEPHSWLTAPVTILAALVTRLWTRRTRTRP